MERMITASKFKLPSAKNKQIIDEYINTTRIYRKSWILAENPSLSQIFDQYPRLDFNGEMKTCELFFFLLNCFQYLILSKARENVKEKEKKRKHDNDDNDDLNEEQENESENEPLKIEFRSKFLLKLLPEGTNMTEYVKNIRLSSKTNVQPYSMVVSGQSSKSSFIEGDGWIINVNEQGNQVASFDLLFKFYYIMNLEWPESLRNFYNFLESYVYDKDVKPYNIVSSVHTNIFNFNNDLCSDIE